MIHHLYDVHRLTIPPIPYRNCNKMFTNESILQLVTQHSGVILFLVLAFTYVVSLAYRKKKPRSNREMALIGLRDIVTTVNKFKSKGKIDSKYSGDIILGKLTDVWALYLTDNIVHSNDLECFIEQRKLIRNIISRWNVCQNTAEKMVVITDTLELIRSSKLSDGTSTIM